MSPTETQRGEITRYLSFFSNSTALGLQSAGWEMQRPPCSLCQAGDICVPSAAPTKGDTGPPTPGRGSWEDPQSFNTDGPRLCSPPQRHKPPLPGRSCFIRKPRAKWGVCPGMLQKKLKNPHISSEKDHEPNRKYILQNLTLKKPNWNNVMMLNESLDALRTRHARLSGPWGFQLLVGNLN